MAYKRKTFREKLLEDKKDLPKIVNIEGKMRKSWVTGTVVIPKPIEVDKLMKKVPRGKITTINEIRKAVAKKHKASIGCPITCGIFARISAGAADEDIKDGKKKITPYWRTLKGEGKINPKYPGGIREQKELLENEGHKIVQKGNNKFVVENFEAKLCKF